MLKTNPSYPFKLDAIGEIARISRGVQRHICTLAHELLEKGSAKSIREIDAVLVQEYGDRKTYLRRKAIEELLPFHPLRAPMIIREILFYIWERHGSKFNIVFLGPLAKSEKNAFVVSVGGKNLILYCISKQTLTAANIEPLTKYLNEGVKIDKEKLTIAGILVLHVIPSDVPYRKQLDPSANLLFAKYSIKLRRKIIARNRVDEWGRLVAFYLYIRGS